MRPHSRITRACLICGALFTRYASAYRAKHSPKYCSRDCYYQSQITTEADVWSRVLPPDVNDCLVYSGNRMSSGYGRVSINGHLMGAHVYIYRVVVGPIPDGLFVCHHCDNRACVNPNHLYLDTCWGNAQDAHARDRYAVGERHHNATLTTDDVLTMRTLFAQGITQAALARRYGVKPCTVSDIVRRISWRHLP